MKVKFANGVVKECTAPTEQKVYRSGVGAGWVLALTLVGGMTSTELDALVADNNISTLVFITKTESEEEKTIFSLDGYEKVTSSAIRHAENTNDTRVEIQLTKGV